MLARDSVPERFRVEQGCHVNCHGPPCVSPDGVALVKPWENRYPEGIRNVTEGQGWIANPLSPVRIRVGLFAVFRCGRNRSVHIANESAPRNG